MTTHVSSLELSRRLKELGVKQESQFYLVREIGKKAILVQAKKNWPINLTKSRYGTNESRYDDIFSAFLVSELGEMLPTRYASHRFKLGGELRGQISWLCYARGKTEDPCVDADTEADARAKILIYLIEQGIVKP